jgi:hypothetical protein
MPALCLQRSFSPLNHDTFVGGEALFDAELTWPARREGLRPMLASTAKVAVLGERSARTLAGGRFSHAPEGRKVQGSIKNLTGHLRGFQPQAREQPEPGGLTVRLRNRRAVGSYRQYRAAVIRSARLPSAFSVEIVPRDVGSARPSTLQTSAHRPPLVFHNKRRSGKCGMVSALSLMARVGPDFS